MSRVFHTLGVATTESNIQFSGCPFTNGMRNLISGIVNDGDIVYHYCNHGSETAGEDIFVTGENFIPALGKAHREQYHSEQRHENHERIRRDFSVACASKLRQNINPGDFVLMPSDGTHDVVDLISDIPNLKVVETQIGYNDPVAQFRIFPTNTWRSFWRGRADRALDIFNIVSDVSNENEVVCPIQFNDVVMVPVTDPRFVFDTVAYPIIDLSHFTPVAEKDDYFLCLNRIIKSKGIEEAIQLTEILGKRLVIAGPGTFEFEFGEDYELPAHVEFVGMANHEKRNELLSKAACLLTLTRYNEPGGTAAAEAPFSQTPVVATDTGCFTEIVSEGVTGFTGGCMADWVEKADKVGDLKPEPMLAYAYDNFTDKALYPKYKRFWDRIDAFYESGMQVDFVYKGGEKE